MKAFFLLLLLATASLAQTQTPGTVVYWQNAPGTELRDFSGAPLSEGARGPLFGVGDGDLIQLGYFDRATVANPFLGNFTVLFDWAIGDKGDLGNGLFRTSVGFSRTFPPGAILPAAGTPLAIRFCDARPGRKPQFFNTVSNEEGTWNWKTPAAPAMEIRIKLSDPGLVWQGGTASDFRTTIPVPEPSTAALLITAMIGAVWKRPSRSVRSRFNRFNPRVIACAQRHGFPNPSRWLADN